MGKLIVISAPSGAGKTSIIHQLLKVIPELSFSVSASSRERRGNEVHGKDYYFLGIEGFHKKIKEQQQTIRQENLSGRIDKRNCRSVWLSKKGCPQMIIIACACLPNATISNASIPPVQVEVAMKNNSC